jgi:amidase
VVQRLLDAGARLVGKTRTDELAYALDGCNVHEGAPLNPAAPSRLTGGSSSGSASAVAAGEADFAIGTDTAGSVRVPAAWCGLLGLRPTHGRIAVDGLTPLAPSFDTVGWFARSGRILREVGAVLLDGLAQCPPAVDRVVDARLAGMADRDCASTGDAAAQRFEEWIGEPRAVDLGIDLARAAESLRVLQGAEVWQTHGRWIEAVDPYFGPAVGARFQAARRFDSTQIREAERERTTVRARLDAVLAPGTMLCLPCVPGPAPPRDASALQLQAMRARLFPMTALASLTGRPQLTLPVRRAGAFPVGLSLLGWRGGDEALLQAAARVAP